MVRAENQRVTARDRQLVTRGHWCLFLSSWLRVLAHDLDVSDQPINKAVQRTDLG
jgi:hypothetical protein